MSFFRGEQLQARRNLELEKKRLRLQNDPSAIFMRELSAGLPRAAFQTLGSMAVDAARYNLFGGKEKLAIQERAQDVSEAAERRQQEAQDFEAAAALAGQAQKEFAQEKGLGYLIGGQPAKPKQTVKQFPDGTFGVEVAPEQADFSTEDKKSYKRITAEEAKKLQEPKRSENPYLRDALRGSGYNDINSIPFDKKRKEVIKKAAELKKADAESAAKEIETYTKNLDGLISRTAGGALLGEGRAEAIKNARNFANGLQSRYPGLDLSASLFQLRNLEKEGLNESTLKNLQRVLRKDGAKIQDVTIGRSNVQAVRDLNRRDEKLKADIVENQKNIDNQMAIVQKFASNSENAPFLNRDGTVNAEAFKTATPQQKEQLARYAETRSNAFDAQRQNIVLAGKNPGRLGLIKVAGPFGQTRFLVANKAAEDLGTLAAKGTTAAAIIASDDASYEAATGGLEDEDIISIIISTGSPGKEISRQDVLDFAKDHEKSFKEILRGKYNLDKTGVSNAIANFALDSGRGIIGLAPSKPAPKTDKSRLDEAMNDESIIRTIYNKRREAQKMGMESLGQIALAYEKNPAQLRNDVALYLNDKDVKLTIDPADNQKYAQTLVNALQSNRSRYGETKANQVSNIAKKLEIEKNIVEAALKEGGELDSVQVAQLAGAYLKLDPQDELKASLPIESNYEKIIMDALGFSQEKMKSIIDQSGGDRAKIQDLVGIEVIQ